MNETNRNVSRTAQSLAIPRDTVRVRVEWYGFRLGVLQKIGFEAAQKLRERVAAEIKTTFASTYTKEVSLAGALQLEEIAVYSKHATGEKYLINPNKGLS